MFEKISNLIKSSQYHIFLALCIGLISFVSYNLGKIDALKKSPLKIEQGLLGKVQGQDQKANIYSATADSQSSTVSLKKLDTRVVVSKASTTRKYHHTWCASASKIKPENQVWFNTAAEAEAQGYTLAGNCSI